MKIFVMSFMLAAVCLYIVSCSKSAVKPQAPSLTGTWKVVSDSVHDDKSNTKYIGVAGDQFTFTSNNRFFAHEGGNIDTGAFSIEDNEMNINYSYRLNDGVVFHSATGEFQIDKLTDHQVILRTQDNDYGAIYERLVVLSR